MIVRREISRKGSNRCFINDTPTTLSVVKSVGNILVDLHGQHEHQSLLRTDTHIEQLDEFGGFQNELNEFRSRKSRLDNLKKELVELRKKEKLLKEKKDFYEFQLKEINTVSPVEDEDSDLKEELNLLENSQRLLELSVSTYNELYESDAAVYNGLVKIHHMIDELASIDNIFREQYELIDNILAQLSDLADFIRSYKDHIDLDPDNLDNMQQRLAAINRLKKKFGGTLKSVLEYRDKIEEELLIADSFDERIGDLLKEIEQQRSKTAETAAILSDKRLKASVQIEKDITEELKYLGINHPRFKVVLKKIEAPGGTESFVNIGSKRFILNDRGVDELEFYISTNPGEDLKPLAKIASGGEISRTMLALKSVLAKNDRLPLLIFDEIDTGVSGRIAQKVGKSMKSLSAHHQIIAITHLPQIAGQADSHYTVEKVSAADRVITKIRELSKSERITEVAKLLSGEEISESSLVSAKELIESG
jgi:DNA repair protein RecN (Recombination protein N)